MKKRHILLLVAIILTFNIPAFSQKEKISEETYRKGGFYVTMQDFLDQKIKYVGHLETYGKYDVSFSNDGKIVMYDASKITDWGFRDLQDLSYRRHDFHFYGILVNGDIVVYSTNMRKGPNNTMSYELYSLYFSLGYDGEIIKYDKKKTYKLVEGWMRAKDPEMADKLIDGKSLGEKKIMELVAEYDRRRIKASNK